MSMPALELFRAEHPDAQITLLIKPKLAELWKLHSAPNNIIQLKSGFVGTLQTARQLRKANFDEAIILPHSFRAALLPFLAGIPRRTGMPGHSRDWMLTKTVTPPDNTDFSHQAYEYMGLMAPSRELTTIQPPHLELAPELIDAAIAIVEKLPRPLVGMIPGAARGPSKQWPSKHFSQLGQRLVREEKCGIVLFGSNTEMELCTRIAKDIGNNALNLAGRTDLKKWAALLSICDVTITNDSGGMHLSAAVGTPLVAIFGITDPKKTGPIGEHCCVLRGCNNGSRDIARDSQPARDALASISPDQVHAVVLEILP